MLAFFIGPFVGGVAGVVMMCLLQVSGMDSRKEGNDVFGNQ